MWSDFQLVFQWWGTLFLVGAFAYPLTRKLFSGWYDEGYLFAKAVGMAVVAWIICAGGTAGVLPFTNLSIYVALGLVFIFGLFLNFQFSIFNFQSIFKFKFSNNHFKFRISNFKLTQGSIFLLEELFFFGALVSWSFVKSHEPSIHGLEKFMDFGFTQSILNTTFFPAPDMWYAGFTINYYYFGHLVMAVLTKFSGLDLAVTFNLMLATIFAFTATMSFSIGAQLMFLRHSSEGWNLSSKTGSRIKSGMTTVFAGFLTSFLVTMAGNMQTIYAFTRGYTGDDVKPFWELLWPIAGFFQNLPEGINRYWYANATRFIPYTIHEFPSYSFVVSDVHGHVLSLPFVLLAIALLVQIFSSTLHESRNNESGIMNHGVMMRLGFYGVLCGILLMTNALDGPIYFGLFLVLFIIHNSLFTIHQKRDWKKIGLSVVVVAATTALTSLPFLLHFKSFVSGVAVNCPPFFLENLKIGPILFEGVEKCQHSPLWMMWLLWGFFIYCGLWMMAKIFNFQFSIFNQKKKFSMLKAVASQDLLFIVFFVFSLTLIIFPEFFYFKDIYPMHFRSNTMFKLGYDAFILFSIVSAYSIVSMTQRVNASVKARAIFFILLIPQLFLVSIFPIFSIRSYFGELKTYKGLDGLAWLKDAYPDDYAGIQWLNDHKDGPTSPRLRGATRIVPILVEADGDSYTDYARFSAFTGMPTVIGWPVHEWLWRGSYDVVSPRREEVRKIYEARGNELTSLEEVKKILSKYNVKYIIVGTLEREKYKNLEEEKFKLLGKVVFEQGETVIYEIQE